MCGWRKIEKEEGEVERLFRRSLRAMTWVRMSLRGFSNRLEAFDQKGVLCRLSEKIR